MEDVTYVTMVDGEVWEKVDSITNAAVKTLQEVKNVELYGEPVTVKSVKFDIQEGYKIQIDVEADAKTLRYLGKSGFEKVGLEVDGKIKQR